ncbi:MAG: alpha/beta hydrolase [Ilumatobacteraceae bacterium]
MSPRPILLVHGAWHGTWCWAPLQAELDRLGVASWAIDLPGHGLSTERLGDLHTDADAVVAALGAVRDGADGDGVVLVGHSYGGGVITEAATRAVAKDLPIAHLVYLTAYATCAGESVGGLAAALPRENTPLGTVMQAQDDGTFGISPVDRATDVFYGHCTPEQAATAFARLSRQHGASFAQPGTGNPRDTIPSTYVVCTDDRAIHPNHQRIMATRCGAVHELPTDHSPFMSMPAETAAILARIAGA